DRFEVYSTGTEATFVRPLAVQALSELAIDISGQESKTLGRYLEESFDWVVTVGDEANEACSQCFLERSGTYIGRWKTLRGPRVEKRSALRCIEGELIELER
ncbi:MAG: hypothetical protein JOZ19_03510, partial [Rubrobacter sp.]|nr:hypothetical protein [Rubrobacter sp.]